MDVVSRPSIPTPGTLVAGRYRIGRTLGEGGFAVVLAARDEEEDCDVAVKLLQLVGEDSAERFWREARLASKLDSEHVVRVLGSGMFESHPFLVMERLRGRDFSDMIEEKALPLNRVADCVLQACEALAHAHGAGIVHRDIKASNLFETQTEAGVRVVKVLDFGVSKIVATANELERSLTRTGHAGALGSPPYMSPEHIRDARNVDGRADIWSLGVLTYVLLSQRYPFDGGSSPELFAGILERQQPLLRDLGVGVPDEIDDIIAGCLAKDRVDRFPDVGALATAFAPFASPIWRPYGERVVEIVRRSPPPSLPVREVPRGRRAVANPVTRSVPAPGSEPELPIDMGAIESAPTVADSSLASEPSITSVLPTTPRARAVLPNDPPPRLPSLQPSRPQTPQHVPAVITARVPKLARPSRFARRAMLLAGFCIGAVIVAAMKVGARPTTPAPRAPVEFPPVTTALPPLTATVVASAVPVARPEGSSSAPSVAAPVRGPRGRHPRVHFTTPSSSTAAPAAEPPPAPPPATPAPAPATTPADPDLLPNPYRKKT